MRILVLGGYGLIGSEVMRHLAASQLQPVGLARNQPLARRMLPQMQWVSGDLAQMTRAEDWLPLLHGIDAVVNCAGVLQDSRRDDLQAVHCHAIRALIEACERCYVQKFVQISAPGATPDARLAFLSSKAAGDAALRASSLQWTILKPGLVLAHGAYGGSAMLRMLAAFPLLQPMVLADARIQTVAASDAAEAVRLVLCGDIAPKQDYELLEQESHSLSEVLAAVRQWAGYPAARAEWRLPRALGFAVARLADLAGELGWRSPLRSTALHALEAGIIGSPANWQQAGGPQPKSLQQTLQSLPATQQERLFGRTQLLFPVLLLMLALFWLSSGLIGLWQLPAATTVLQGTAVAPLASWLVIGGALADLLIGGALLLRRWTRRAALASFGLALCYLLLGSWLTPQLWLDPLGSFVKVIPALGLALAVAALSEER